MQSMILRNGMNQDKISALAASLQRGKALIASGNQLIDNSKKLLA